MTYTAANQSLGYFNLGDIIDESFPSIQRFVHETYYKVIDLYENSIRIVENSYDLIYRILDNYSSELEKRIMMFGKKIQKGNGNTRNKGGGFGHGQRSNGSVGTKLPQIKLPKIKLPSIKSNGQKNGG